MFRDRQRRCNSEKKIIYYFIKFVICKLNVKAQALNKTIFKHAFLPNIVIKKLKKYQFCLILYSILVKIQLSFGLKVNKLKKEGRKKLSKVASALSLILFTSGYAPRVL